MTAPLDPADLLGISGLLTQGSRAPVTLPD